MKTVVSQFPLRSWCLRAVLCVAVLPAARAQTATPAATPAGAPKVRVIVQENNLASSVGSSAPAAPAAAGAAKAAGPTPPAAVLAADAAKWTRTTKKSLAIEVVNLTPASMDVNVKTTFLAKDEVGKRDVLPETTQEHKLTVPPGKAQSFTTDEVDFTHTSAHRSPPAKAAGGGASAKPAIAPMIPASGHAYFGYKVEVFQENNLVGSTASQNH